MAVTVESFLVRYPEFRPAGDELLQSVIDEAELQVDTVLWAAKADAGVMALAAHILAVSPFGQNAKLATKKGETTYQKRFEAMQLQVTAGHRLI